MHINPPIVSLDAGDLRQGVSPIEQALLDTIGLVLPLAATIPAEALILSAVDELNALLEKPNRQPSAVEMTELLTAAAFLTAAAERIFAKVAPKGGAA